ncbi:hypothetical protein JCM17843_24000 [Kordiimonadales bacterium JCM 17843]|nr:hypothetical protein JCM17843_24000 [Kordiimonadales bacterium JCM 17843]
MDALVFLLAAILAALGVARLRWSPVVGYMVAGAVIGPFVLGLVDDSPQIHMLAEFGVVFLMFTIGLELSPQRLRAMRGMIFGLGGLQVVLSAAAIGLAASLLGLTMEAAVVVGLALGLSSTAVVMRLLLDQDALATKVGRRTFSVLLFQDIAVVPILLLVSALADGAPAFSLAALKASGKRLSPLWLCGGLDGLPPSLFSALWRVPKTLNCSLPPLCWWFWGLPGPWNGWDCLWNWGHFWRACCLRKPNTERRWNWISNLIAVCFWGCFS